MEEKFLSVSGDVASLGGVLAGLILVFLGGICTSFDSYGKEQQGFVKSSYRSQAWWAFAGFALSVLSAVCGLAAKLRHSEELAVVAFVAACAALFVVIAAAFNSARGIK